MIFMDFLGKFFKITKKIMKIYIFFEKNSTYVYKNSWEESKTTVQLELHLGVWEQKNTKKNPI